MFFHWRPSYKFDKKSAFELINYGKQVVGANILVFLITIIDVAFIGRILGADDLGYYSIAMGVAGLLTTQVAVLMRSVMFPIYSTIQDDSRTLKRAYLKTIKYVPLISIPASLGIFAISGDFVQVVYGSKWLPAVATLQVLSFYGLNRSLLSTTENLYLATGRPQIRTELNLLQLVLMAVLMYPLMMRYGIMGVAIAATLPSVLVVVLTLREAGKIIGESFGFIARTFVPSIMGSLVMVVGIYAWYYVAAGLGPVLRLGVSVVIGTVVYVGFLWITKRELFYEIRELVGRK